MKSKAILFSAAMVHALISGKKTQTRRIIKLQPDLVAGDNAYRQASTSKAIDQWIKITCPYGNSGDQLWVKETWTHNAYPNPMSDNPAFYYKADPPDPFTQYEQAKKWISPIFMPRIASRISLQINHVTVERLNECGHTDALAEGIESESARSDAVKTYKTLWESINGVDSWLENPWVWMVKFKILTDTNSFIK